MVSLALNVSYCLHSSQAITIILTFVYIYNLQSQKGGFSFKTQDTCISCFSQETLTVLFRCSLQTLETKLVSCNNPIMWTNPQASQFPVGCLEQDGGGWVITGPPWVLSMWLCWLAALWSASLCSSIQTLSLSQCWDLALLRLSAFVGLIKNESLFRRFPLLVLASIIPQEEGQFWAAISLMVIGRVWSSFSLRGKYMEIKYSVKTLAAF